MAITNRPWLNRRWRGALIAVLGILLCFVGVSHALTKGEIDTLRDSNAQLIGVLETQTDVIIDLRGKLQPRDFESIEELQGWVYDWVLNKKPIVADFFGMEVVFRGDNDIYSRYRDCEDYSEAMQRDALWDGYRVSEALVDSHGAVYGVPVSPYSNHAGCLSVAGGAYYFVEPQTGEIVFIIQRD